jgi:hypothetical protein
MASTPANPLVGPDARAHLASLIGRAEAAATDARSVADTYGLAEAAERIAWALDFLADAKLEAEGRRDG